jgi:TATA-binding protein-associated factor Taf7
MIPLKAIEEVEKEVERLLEIDATAEDVQYGSINRVFEYIILN